MTIPFKVNGTVLLTRPEEHGWVDRPVLGYDGTHHPIYPYLREYELNWGILEQDSFQQLYNFYVLTSTGTAIVYLPQYAGTIDPDNFDACFIPYSGCTISEPTFKGFMDGFYKSVKVVVLGVRI